MSNSVYFIDSKLENYETIIASLSSTDIYYIIDSSSDGLTQISNILSNYSNLDSIHIYSHGSIGSLNIGSTIYNEDNIDLYKNELELIGSSLSSSGDILLYGCNVAQDEVGQSFINTLASYTNANIAASNDLTGNSILGGNWDLEVSSGTIESQVVGIEVYEGILVDDYANDKSGATLITLDTLTYRTLETYGDVDYFKIDLIAGTNYLFEMNNISLGTSGTAYLNLYDDSSFSRLEYGYENYLEDKAYFYFTTETSGTYYLEASELGDDSIGNYSINVSKGLDNIVPTLTSFDMPTNIDISAGTVNFGINASASDNLSGIDKLVIWFDHKISYNTSQTSTYFSNYNLIGLFGIYDDWSDGNVSETKYISSTNANGTYNITSIDLTDNSNNKITYTATDLKNMGFNTSFEITGGTTTLPEIVMTPSIENGEIVLSISTNTWNSTSNTLKFTLNYDSSIGHYKEYKSGGSGAYSVSSSISEIGSVGKLIFNSTISNYGDNTDIIKLIFTPTTLDSDFSFSTSSSYINSISAGIINDSFDYYIASAPTSADKTITINEDVSKTLTLADFAFSDSNNGEYLLKVKITSLETKGTLKLNGVDVTLNQEISASDIQAGKLVYKANSNEFGSSYSNFKFQVSDGSLYSTSSYTMNFNVTQVIDTISKSVSYTLPSLIENLTLTGTSNINGSGNDLNNVITGNAGNNILNGKAGADKMLGASGNDTYYVDNSSDKVYETKTTSLTSGDAGGTDKVISSISYNLGSYVENLTLTGTSNINGTGNSLNNVITGNAGNNILNGKIGADKMLGASGNDTYYVDNSSDKVYETKTTSLTSGDAGGIDKVNSSISYTLTSYVENLTLTGTANINGTGNSLNNVITGNAGNNILNGKAGNDILIGGAGLDSFVFNTTLGTSNIDTIKNFSITDDTIKLENAIFTKLLSGTFNSTTKVLNAANFAKNIDGVAKDNDDYIIYETDTGKLFYDADANGSGTAIQFALVDNKANLTNADFVVI